VVHHIFRNFLASVESYRQVELYWEALFYDVASQYGQAANWKPWLSRTFLNGTPTPRDGNPIFDARSEKLRRAVRIIQSPPEKNEIEIAAWIDTVDYSDSGGPGYTEELVLNLALSEESADAVRQILARWMDPSVSAAQMAEVVGRLEEPSRGTSAHEYKSASPAGPLKADGLPLTADSRQLTAPVV
jgi:hypothetical protein